jgi:hypothetical protein
MSKPGGDPSSGISSGARQEVWITTGSAIVDWYEQNYLKNA